MRVFGELSFDILIITCFTLFVHIQDQTVVADSKVQANERVTETSQSDQPDKIRAVSNRTSDHYDDDDEGTTDEEAKAFFDCLVQPRPPRIQKIDFAQKLDHTNASDGRTWIQRAYLDSQYEKNDGLVLLKVGGFKKIDPYELEDPTMVVLAKRYHASCYILEHRYRGESVPTDLSADHLKLYLNSEQALADINNFIKKSKHRERKWIVFGTAYGGTLAAWFRLKYAAATAAIAYSAPMYSKTEVQGTYTLFTIFDEHVKEALTKAFTEIGEATTSDKYGKLKEKFNMCTQLDEGNRDDNVIFMHWSILSYLVDIIISDNNEVMNLLKSISINSPLDTLSTVVKKINGEKCFTVSYDDAINQYKNLKIKYKNEIDYPNALELGLGIRPDFYQRCKEFGLFETSNDGKLSFGAIINLDFYTKICKKAFDMNFDSNMCAQSMDTTNTIYGGYNIAASNLLYYSPMVCSFNGIGIEKSTSNEIILINDEVLSDTTLMKFQYDVIIERLNKWTSENTEAGDNSEVDATK